MIVYVDIYFFMNSLMNFFILSLLSSVFNYYGKIKNRIVASVLGGFGATFYLVFLSEKGNLYRNIFLIVCSVMLILIAYEKTNWRIFLKQWICFYLIAYCFGGVLYWLLQETKGGYYITLVLKYSFLRQTYLKKFIIISLACSMLLSFLFWIGKGVKEERQFLYPVSLKLHTNILHTIGLLDTGNRLREPKTGGAVLVVELAIIEKGLNENVKQWLHLYFQDPIKQKIQGEIPKGIAFIPFSSVGKKAGELPAILCEEVVIAKKGETCKKNVWLGITTQNLSSAGEYFLLLHTDLWKK